MENSFTKLVCERFVQICQVYLLQVLRNYINWYIDHKIKTCHDSSENIKICKLSFQHSWGTQFSLHDNRDHHGYKRFQFWSHYNMKKVNRVGLRSNVGRIGKTIKLSKTSSWKWFHFISSRSNGNQHLF